MTNFLTRIEAYKRAEIAAAKRAYPPEALRRDAEAAPPVRGFLAAIERRVEQGEYALIGELKKASPSKGLIRADFDPPALARAYQEGGAACLSVLTDVPSFQGSPEYLAAARSATSLPVLRKDFMYDPYQVLEARAWGADCVLVILALVDDATAKDLADTAYELGMDALVEVHDEHERDRALGMDARLIGINNKDLRTFETNLSTSESLAPGIPAGRVVVSESGLTGPADLARMAAAGILTFLIGEGLMRRADLETATRALLARIGTTSSFGSPATE
ncbi:MAG: indole-3-glycerol phosphate synthase TrpC [Kibdelosporangium sp.]